MKTTTIFILLFIFLFLLTGQLVYSQTTFNGKLNFNKKEKLMLLISETDSIRVSFQKKKISFDYENGIDFQWIKLKNKRYNLVVNADTIKVTESNAKIEFSNGLSFTILTKKAHRIVLTDSDNKPVLDAKYDLKKNIANFMIIISEKKMETELISFATKYLYELSLDEVNTIPYMSSDN